MVTTETWITQMLPTVQLRQFIPETGKLQQGPMKTVLQAPTKTTAPMSKAVEVDLEAAKAMRKLTFYIGETEGLPIMADVVRGNCNVQKGMQLSFYSPKINDGIKVVKLNPDEVTTQCREWECTLIGYVIRGNLPSKEMLNFILYMVYGLKCKPQMYFYMMMTISYFDSRLLKRSCS